MRRLALLLTYLLPAPVMLLAANRLSTGVGVRPREERLEVTADFTPDPNLMVAATTLITAVIAAVLEWPEHGLGELRRRGFPVFANFKPRRHTSRKGFLARQDCFPANPFQADPNETRWRTRRWPRADPARDRARPSRALSAAPCAGSPMPRRCATSSRCSAGTRARCSISPTAPRRYEDVGRVIDWNRRRAIHELPRSKYEKVIHRIITHRPIRVDGSLYHPERMRGWYEVVFRQAKTGRQRVFNLDDLVLHCEV